jgi:hypothetical protein
LPFSNEAASSADRMASTRSGPLRAEDSICGGPGVWLVDKKRWAVTADGAHYNPADSQSVLGYVTHGSDGEWRIEGDPLERRYLAAEHAVKDIVRSHSR